MFLVNRAVEKHLQTFHHRERKKVRELWSLLFLFFNFRCHALLSFFKFQNSLSVIGCSYLHSWIGLVGALGMHFTLMSLLRVLKKASKGE